LAIEKPALSHNISNGLFTPPTRTHRNSKLSWDETKLSSLVASAVWTSHKESVSSVSQHLSINVPVTSYEMNQYVNQSAILMYSGITVLCW